MANATLNPCLRKGPRLLKSLLKMMSSKCSSFWLTILCLVDMFFNKLSVFYGYELCPSSRWLVPLLIWGRLQTGASQEKRKEAIPIFNFGDFVDPIYSIEFEINDTTDTARSALCLDNHNKIDSEGQFRTKLYDKRDDFYFLIKLCSTFQQHLHMEYISPSWSDIPELVVPIMISLI